MKNVFYAVSVFCLCTAMMSCNNTNKKTETVRTANGETEVVTTTTTTQNRTNRQATDPGLLEGEWNVVELNGYPVQTGQENSPYMGFNLSERRVYGYSGCNMMTGELMVDSTRNGVIAFDKMAMTRKACPNDTMETPFVNAVNGIKGYRVIDCNDNNNNNSNCKIALLDGNNNTIITLQKRTDMNNNNYSNQQ